MTKLEKELTKDLNRCIEVRDEMIEQAQQFRAQGNKLIKDGDEEQGAQAIMMAVLLEHYINKMF